MRYPPALVDRLAAEYALGTLHGRARQRFEALMHLRADIRIAVWSWENILHGLTSSLEPVTPPPAVWRRIRSQVVVERQPSRAIWRRLPGMATVAAIVAALAFWLGTAVPPSTPPMHVERVAIISGESAQALWVIKADVDNARLIAESTGVPAASDNRVYELWALPEGGAPQSLGVLSAAAGRFESTLTPALVDAIEKSASFAISLEPAGGSPTGAPTGPVVYQASLVSL